MSATRSVPQRRAVRSGGTTRDAVWSANAPFGRVFLMVKLHPLRAIASERPPIPFRRVSVVIRRHEHARSELPRGLHVATRRPQRPREREDERGAHTHSRPGGASASAQPWARGSGRTSAGRTRAQ
jgi:hypothetical protein